MNPTNRRIALIAPLMRQYRIALASGAIILVALLAMPMIVTTVSPGFFARYHDLAQHQEELQTSLHAGIACSGCHSDSLVYNIALVGDFYASLASPQDTPVFLDFSTPENAACLRCHETDWSHDNERTSRIPHPAHLRVASETRECVSCHKWTAHQETYIDEHKKMPFSGVCASYGCHVGTKSNDDCTSCHHALREDGEDWLADHSGVTRAMGVNTCLEACHEANECRLCHTTGERPIFDGLVTETGMRAIERLHVESDWIDRHGVEAIDDQPACMKCHVSDSECRACHSQRPASHDPKSTWIGQHKDVVVDERRCLTCHEQAWCEDCHDQFKEMR